VILKKSFLQELVGRKKLHTARMKWKKIIALLQARKNMLQSHFIIPGGGGSFTKTQQNCNHSG